jgi:SDR family mycofactocin-dependent oxidoreductase
VALITGAARGQGREHAVRFAAEGADLILVDQREPAEDPDGIARTAELVEADGRRAVAAGADVRDPEQMAAAVGAGVERLGRLDAVVANAGVLSVAPVMEETQEGWQRTIDVNLTGVWNTCRAAIPALIDGGGGAIVIIGSTQAFKASAQIAAYVASKHGVVGLAKALAVELAEEMVRVNSVHPTTVFSPMIAEIAPEGMSEEELRAHYRPINALPVPWVEPVDVSNAVMFLASEEARYVTGAALPVDAGSLLVGGRPG